MAKKKSSSFLPKLAMGVIFAIAVIYAVYHLISLFSGGDIKTIASGVTTHSVTVGGTGYIFRDETLLSADNTGAVDYLVQDGQKVSLDQHLADVYEGNGALKRELIFTLDGQIALLEKSRAGAEPLDLAELRKQANDTYYRLVELLATDNTGELSAQIESMMITLNRISDLVDNDVSIDETIEILKKNREKLFDGEGQSAYAPFSGYFYYMPDGYEKSFSISAADELTAEDFDELVASVDNNSGSVSKNVFGKMARTSFWKLAVPLDKKDTEKFEQGQTCNVVFPENNRTELTMTLERVIEDGDRVICIFYCNRLPENFSFDRCQSVEIEVLSASGIYVPRSALAKVDGIQGVYVLRGSVVHFRRVEIVYRGSDYCLVAENASEEGGYYALGTNELIIINGKNLFDGRILE